MFWRLKYEPTSVFAQRIIGKIKSKTTHPIKPGRRVKAWIADMWGDESQTWTIPAHWEYGTVGIVEEGKFEVIFDYCKKCSGSDRQTAGISCWAFPWAYGESEIPI